MAFGEKKEKADQPAPDATGGTPAAGTGTTASEAPTKEQPAVDETTPAPPPQPDPESAKSDEEFRTQQRTLAQAQNLFQENAVPEQRPQAFLEGPGDSELTKKLKESGAIPGDEPMPASAYQKAASDAQMETAAENSQAEAVHAGSVIRVTAGPHEGRIVAITRVEEYQNQEDLVNVAAGRPEQRFAHPQRIEGSARGDERDGEILVLDTENGDEWEAVRDFSTRRAR